MNTKQNYFGDLIMKVCINFSIIVTILFLVLLFTTLGKPTAQVFACGGFVTFLFLGVFFIRSKEITEEEGYDLIE